MRNELMNEPASDEKSEQKTTKTEDHKIRMTEGFFQGKNQFFKTKLMMASLRITKNIDHYHTKKFKD